MSAGSDCGEFCRRGSPVGHENSVIIKLAEIVTANSPRVFGEIGSDFLACDKPPQTQEARHAHSQALSTRRRMPALAAG